ncbi:Actin-like protein arp5 [Golovinomyces cichoracearum]|uniref:Actin-like protein arp5 n=1 Tax=Golovinomyces cichoracearum TaxID=62708 RepID=A0A420HQX4_9PEZI|nr:Actin-like protein arp5 [Golovinomyces cichoracearum]
MTFSGVDQVSSQDKYPPIKTYAPREAHFEQYTEVQTDGYQQARSHGLENSVIVIDNGSSSTRAGWSFEKTPRISCTPILSKYRDRRFNQTYAFVGADAYADTTARGHIRNAFEAGSGIVSNWDVMESVLDYIFIKMGIEGSNDRVEVPILMTEAIANIPYSRKNTWLTSQIAMTEIIFEAYRAPSLTYGIDALFSYNYNQGKTGLIVSSSHTSTHVIPVLNTKAILSQATRLNWGGFQGAEYLLKLLKLKYPNFPGKLNSLHTESMFKDHCYLSKNYDEELANYLDWNYLEKHDCVIQFPYTEEIIIQKSQEELDKIAEKRKESGRRLQEQAAKVRLEKLIRKEQQLDYYRELQTRLNGTTKKETKRILESEDLKDEAALEKIIKELDKSIRRARTKDVGGPEADEEAVEPDFSLLMIPDDQLDESRIKQKRHQRLMKSSHEARARARAEKEKEKARVAEIKRLDEEKRDKDREGWLQERRDTRIELMQKIKERDRLKADLGNRKSLASQIRMKSIASLASDNPSKKRRRGGDDDNFGANDDDWGVYRQITVGEGSEDEEEEDLGESLKKLEAELLQWDPEFTEKHTLEAQNDWTKSLIHAFLRGPRPFDPDSQAEAHQIQLNVERIRVPEVIFQPSIAGIDQAGLVEVVSDILTHRLKRIGDSDTFLKDIFLTGGAVLLQNFDERLRDGLRSFLPMGAELSIRKAHDPILDAWKGAARWAGGPEWKMAAVTREEYLENGADYMKEHNFGNALIL